MNWLDYLIIVSIVAGLVKGMFDGFIKEIISSTALILAIFFAGHIAIPVQNFLSYYITCNIPFSVFNVIGYIIGFLLIILIITIIGKIIDVAIKMTPITALNILLGGLFGIITWILSLSILFNLLEILNSDFMLLSQQTQENSLFYNHIKTVLQIIYPLWKHSFSIL